jgi:hypothetical protein
MALGFFSLEQQPPIWLIENPSKQMWKNQTN